MANEDPEITVEKLKEIAEKEAQVLRDLIGPDAVVIIILGKDQEGRSLYYSAARGRPFSIMGAMNRLGPQIERSMFGSSEIERPK